MSEHAGIRNNKFPDFKQALIAEQKKRLDRAAIVVEREAKHLLSFSGTGVWKSLGSGAAKVRYLAPAKSAKGKKVYGAFPSMPGEPPHKQTGWLRSSVTWEVIHWGWGYVARVGTNVLYGKFLQIGTRHMRPRPWLDVALSKSTVQIKAIMNAPWKWAG